MTATVSVVIPTYNRASLCLDAVGAALAQTYPPSEVIVIDDGSTDETAELFKDAKPPIRYVRQENAERAAARNKGVAKATGDLVAFLDSDDLWDKRHLAVSVAALGAHRNAALAFGRAIYMSPGGKLLWEAPSPQLASSESETGDALAALARRAIGFPLSSVVGRREVFTANPFNEDRRLSRSEDWELWVRLAARHSVVSTGEATTFLRMHEGNTSQDAKAVAETMERALAYVLADPEAGPAMAKYEKSVEAAMQLEIARLEYKAGDRRAARERLSRARALDRDASHEHEARRLALMIYMPRPLTALARRLRRILAERPRGSRRGDSTATKDLEPN